jgi:hypothetical protein
MPDSAAVIHMVNSALYRLGEKPITSLDQGTPVSNLCRELYPDVRDTLLSWQAWPFATVRQSLSRLLATPLSDYSYYYALPAIPAVVRVLDIELTSRHADYQREIYLNPVNPYDQQAVIATNVSSVIMKYIGVTSEGLWSPLFQSTLAVWLAATMAPNLSGKAQLRETLLTELYGAGREPGLLAKLRDIAGYEDSPRAMPLPTTYIDVRGSTGGTAPTTVWWP